MKPVLLLAISLVLIITSCQPVAHHDRKSETVDKLDHMSWILGKWEMKTPDGTILEQWEQPSDTQWSGVSYMVTPTGDTNFGEHIRLDYSGDTLYYIPTVSNQNAGQEVSFVEKSFSDSLVVFENIQHDFPQRIIYRRISDNNILAAIEGNQDGKNRREEYAYTRAK